MAQDFNDDKYAPHRGPSQKWLLLGLFIIGIGALILGFWNMSGAIKNSWVPDKIASQNTITTTVDKTSETLLDLRNKDTDKDGLSDYDELYIYDTNPYLEDSDSDNYSDKEEIDTDNDPNCPRGRTCYQTSQPTDTATESSSPSETSSFVGTSTDLAVLGDITNLTGAEIRQLLIEQGAPAEMLADIDDETLRTLFLQELGEKLEEETNE
jgi:hypothetical protein